MESIGTRLKSFLLAQNCWYLISGFLMLLGCLLMSQAPGADGIGLAEGLKLQTVVMLYQITVVSLAIYVRRRLGVEHDAFNLALVALVLLPDPTFFSTRFWGHSREAGLMVNSLALVSSACMLLALKEFGRFPLGRGPTCVWLGTLVLVYASGAGLEPGAAMQNQQFMNWLSFAPLVLALVACGWGDEDQSSKSGRSKAASASHPVLWGDPSRIYRRYMAAVLFFFPFAVVLRHMEGLAAVFAVDLLPVHAAPAILGLAVLGVKAFPVLIEYPAFAGLLGFISIVVATPPGRSFHGSEAAILFAIVVVFNLMLGLWLYARRQFPGFPAYPAFAAAVLVSGSNLDIALSGIFNLELAPVLVFALAAVIHALRDQGFWETHLAAVSVCLVFARLAEVKTVWAILGVTHAAGWLYVAGVYLYPRKDLRNSCAPVAALLLLLLIPGASPGASHGNAGYYQLLLFGESAALICLGLIFGLAELICVGISAVAIHCGLAFSGSFRRLDLARILWTWGGPLAITLAFATLGLGLASSRTRRAVD